MEKSKVKSQKSKIGFTLIELLVVISIIGILAALLLARFGTAEKSGRDAQRKSDINQYRIALENSAVNTNGVYPSRTTGAGDRASTLLCGDLGTSYLADCPEDPRYSASSWDYYRYQSNGSGGGAVDATQYVLWAKKETGLDYWVACSDGKIGELSSVSVSSGNCPL